VNIKDAFASPLMIECHHAADGLFLRHTWLQKEADEIYKQAAQKGQELYKDLNGRCANARWIKVGKFRVKHPQWVKDCRARDRFLKGYFGGKGITGRLRVFRTAFNVTPWDALGPVRQKTAVALAPWIEARLNSVRGIQSKLSQAAIGDNNAGMQTLSFINDALMNLQGSLDNRRKLADGSDEARILALSASSRHAVAAARNLQQAEEALKGVPTRKPESSQGRDPHQPGGSHGGGSGGSVTEVHHHHHYCDHRVQDSTSLVTSTASVASPQ
jgi:hypothetical protein